jgi:hypothetical protein
MVNPLAKFSLPVALMALVVSMLALVAMAPEPSAVPRKWELEFKPGALSLTSLTLTENGQQVTRSYYYMIYTVTNRTSTDVLFAPSFDLVAGDGAVQRSGRGVSAEATKQLIARLNNSLLQDQITIIGSLGVGPENARTGLVAWPAESLRPGSITIYAAGFSGETAVVQKPGTTKAEDRVTLRKTKMLRYADVGELTGRADKPLPLAEERWIMR